MAGKTPRVCRPEKTRNKKNARGTAAPGDECGTVPNIPRHLSGGAFLVLYYQPQVNQEKETFA